MKKLLILIIAGGLSLVGMKLEGNVHTEDAVFEFSSLEKARALRTSLQAKSNYRMVILESAPPARYFVISSKMASLSSTVKNLLKSSSPDAIIPLPSISGKILATIIGCMQEFQKGESACSLGSDEDIADITIAANYLDIKKGEGAAATESFSKKYVIPTCAAQLLCCDLDKLQDEAEYKKYKEGVLDKFSPDLQRLIINEGARFLMVTHTYDHYQLGRRYGKDSFVAFGSNGQLIATAGRDGSVWLWNSNNLATVASFNTGNRVDGIVFSPDGQFIATAGGGIKLWNIKDLTAPMTTFNPGEWISPIAFSPDGQFIATVGGGIKLWNIKDLAAPAVDLEGSLIAFSPNGQLIATAGMGIRLWNKHNLTAPTATLSNGGQVNSIIFSPNGHLIATAQEDGVRLWNSNNLAPIATLNTGTSMSSIAFSPDGRRIAIGGSSEAQLWNVENPGNPILISTFKLFNIASHMPMAFSPNGSLHIVTTEHYGAKFWVLPDTSRLDLASAQILAYSNRMFASHLLTEYLLARLNEYGRKFIDSIKVPAKESVQSTPSTSTPVVAPEAALEVPEEAPAQSTPAVWYQRAWNWVKEKISG